MISLIFIFLVMFYLLLLWIKSGGNFLIFPTLHLPHKSYSLSPKLIVLDLSKSGCIYIHFWTNPRQVIWDGRSMNLSTDISWMASKTRKKRWYLKPYVGEIPVSVTPYGVTLILLSQPFSCPGISNCDCEEMFRVLSVYWSVSGGVHLNLWVLISVIESWSKYVFMN